MQLHAYVGRLLKDEPYAKSVQSKFFDHCDNTVNLDALSRCRALNELLETHVSFRAITVWNGLHRNDDFALQLLWKSNPTPHTGGVRQLGHLRVHLPSNKVSRKPRSEKCIETVGKQRGDACGGRTSQVEGSVGAVTSQAYQSGHTRTWVYTSTQLESASCEFGCYVADGTSQPISGNGKADTKLTASAHATLPRVTTYTQCKSAMGRQALQGSRCAQFMSPVQRLSNAAIPEVVR